MSEVMPETWREGVAQNPYQGDYRRVLCACSGGILRSPTLSYVLSREPYNCNTRVVGTHKEFALVPIDQILVDWAHDVVFVNEENRERAVQMGIKLPKRVYVLNVPDSFAYRDPWLIAKLNSELDRVDFSDDSKKFAHQD